MDLSRINGGSNVGGLFSGFTYNIIDLEKAIPDDVAGRIKAHPDVIRTRVIRYKE